MVWGIGLVNLGYKVSVFWGVSVAGVFTTVVGCHLAV